MSVEIIIPPSLQPLTGGESAISASAGTIRNCLEDLADKYPELRARLFNKSGRLAGGLNVFINAEAAYPGALARLVRDGDRLYLSYIVMGG